MRTRLWRVLAAALLALSLGLGSPLAVPLATPPLSVADPGGAHGGGG